eukprot:TRINITY_DN9250_c0_g1_i1.p1 TRINITY_DN9250_c0_g1~~TRINITY_DN9250_c0_g1_i1.p1  ORF type:complete len:245 (-),score=49.31 TRINITY_DN9250_c0_g1_i1:238-972(-)
METATSISSNPRTVEDVFKDFKGRRSAIVRALTAEVEEFYLLCDPEKENLCLYGYPNDTWEVNLPAEEVPPELPEPVLGINFARDGMQRKDWLSLVAVHSDSWLLAVAYYHGARFNSSERRRLFSMINELPTVFELVSEKNLIKDKASNSRNNGSKTHSLGKRTSDGEIKASKQQAIEDEQNYDEEQSDTICGICGGIYTELEFWIGCDMCEKWYHGKCVKITEAKAQSIRQYKCPLCSTKKAR